MPREYDCATLFTEDELRRAHALIMPEAEAAALASDLAGAAGRPSIGRAWSQASLILLSLLGPDLAARVAWARQHCGWVSAGSLWDEEVVKITEVVRSRESPKGDTP